MPGNTEDEPAERTKELEEYEAYYLRKIKMYRIAFEKERSDLIAEVKRVQEGFVEVKKELRSMAKRIADLEVKNRYYKSRLGKADC